MSRKAQKYSRAVTMSASQATEDRKRDLVETTQGTVSKQLLYSDQMRLQTRKLSEYATLVTEIDRGDMYNFCQFYQYMLDNDTDISSICSSRRDRVISANFEVSAPEGATDTDSIKAAQLCEHALKELPNWFKIRFAISEAIILGYSANEIEWSYSGGLFLPSDIVRRNPNRFIYSPTWELRLSDRYTRGGMEGEKLIEDKWVVHHSSEREGTPNFYGVVRVLGNFFIKRAWVDQFQIHYLEKFGQPHVHAKCSDNASSKVMAEVQAIIDRGSYDHNYVTKGETSLEIVQPSSLSSIDGFERYLEQSKGAMARYVLGTSDLNDAGATGSFAAVEQRTASVADTKRNRDMMNFAATIQKQLFIPIIKFNSALFSVKPKLPLYREIYGDELVTASGKSAVTGQQMSKSFKAPELYFNEFHDSEGRFGTTDNADGPVGKTPKADDPIWSDPTKVHLTRGVFREKTARERVLDDDAESAGELWKKSADNGDDDKTQKKLEDIYLRKVRLAGKAEERANREYLEKHDELFSSIKTEQYSSDSSNPYKIEATEAVTSFEKTDTFRDKLFNSLIDELRTKGVSEDKIAAAKSELQRITLDAVKNGKSAAEASKAIMDSAVMKSVGIDASYDAYLQQAAQLNQDMAYSGAKWDQVTDLAEETGKRYYWQYHSLEDGNVRPTHVKINGAVFIVGNEDTDRLLPPVDFGCRCYWDMLEEVPKGAVLYEEVPPEFEDAINPDFEW